MRPIGRFLGNVLPALMQKLVGEFLFAVSQGFGQEFRRIFRTRKIKAQKDQGRIQSILRKKFVAQDIFTTPKILSADVPP